MRERVSAALRMTARERAERPRVHALPRVKPHGVAPGSFLLLLHSVAVVFQYGYQPFWSIHNQPLPTSIALVGRLRILRMGRARLCHSLPSSARSCVLCLPVPSSVVKRFSCITLAAAHSLCLSLPRGPFSQIGASTAPCACRGSCERTRACGGNWTALARRALNVSEWVGRAGLTTD